MRKKAFAESGVRHRLILLASSGFTRVFYGGMHSIKWYVQFPSETERLLWRISSCVGVIGIFPIIALSLLNFTRRQSPLYFFGMGFGVASGFLFVVARSYLIVESFLRMRSLPQAAYHTVRWGRVITPHLIL